MKITLVFNKITWDQSSICTTNSSLNTTKGTTWPEVNFSQSKTISALGAGKSAFFRANNHVKTIVRLPLQY